MTDSIYERARRLWGIASQIQLCAEEATELALACLHLLRKKHMESLEFDRLIALDKLADEIADVEFMNDQMRHCFHEEHLEDKIKLYRDHKEKRLLERIEEEEYECAHHTEVLEK